MHDDPRLTHMLALIKELGELACAEQTRELHKAVKTDGSWVTKVDVFIEAVGLSASQLTVDPWLLVGENGKVMKSIKEVKTGICQ